MILEALLDDRPLHRRHRSADRKHDDPDMRYFKLWLRKAWEESEKGMECRRGLSLRAEEARQ